MADTFSIKVGGALEFKRELAAVRDQLQPQLLTMAIEAGKVALGVARASTPVDTDSPLASKRVARQHTRDGWFLHVIGGSHRGRGFLVVLDHEWNKPGKFPRSDRKLGYSLLDILEYGTRAHIITPKSERMTRLSMRAGGVFALGGIGARALRRARNQGARYLRFVVGGRTVFSRRVHHPGTKAYAMTRKAAAVGARAWQQLAVKAVESAFAKLKGR